MSTREYAVGTNTMDGYIPNIRTPVPQLRDERRDDLVAHANSVQKSLADVLTENDQLRKRVASLEKQLFEAYDTMHSQLKVMEGQMVKARDEDRL